MRIGVYSKTRAVTFSQLERACSAIQDQLRQVRAAWDLSEEFTIEPCRRRSNPTNISYVTVSEHPLFLSAFRAPAPADESQPAEGRTAGEHGVIHGNVAATDNPGRPYAQVRFIESRAEDHHWWTVTLSHECVEMAVNPYMDRTLRAPPPAGFAQSGHADGDEPVAYLKEICDPCQSGWHAYPHDVAGSADPIWLSDFVLPEYFERPAQGSRFSFNGSVTQPLEILKHGCLSWGVPRTKKLWQQWRFGDGKLSDFICVRDWEPAPADGGAPRADERNARQSLYAAQPDYRMHRVPDQNRVADALRRRKPT